MPSRFYLRGSDEGLDFMTLRGSINPENNVFDRAFKTDPVAMEEWDDRMRWEGELEAPAFDRKNSSESIVFSQEDWPTDFESAELDTVSAPFMAENEISFEDAPFELEGPGSEALPMDSEVRRGVSDRGYSSLTQAEEQSLPNIAMPYLLPRVKISDATPLATSHSSPSTSVFPSPSPEPTTRTRKNKKRKSVIEDDDAPTSLCQSRKRGHNAIEKRYRTNLNDKIDCLRQGVPGLCRTSSSDSKSGDEMDDSDGEQMDSKSGQQKYGKAAILTRALEYIKYLEATTQQLGSEVMVLKTRVGAFEKLAMSGSIIMNASTGAQMSEPPLVKSETLESIQAGTFLLQM
jgi:hypothetical protein